MSESDFVEKIPYTCKGKDYEIVVKKVINGFLIRPFLNGKPANCYTYSVDFTEYIGLVDLKWNSKEDIFNKLLNSVKSDLNNGFGIPLEKKINNEFLIIICRV